jgi:hypothetical protein
MVPVITLPYAVRKADFLQIVDTLDAKRARLYVTIWLRNKNDRKKADNDYHHKQFNQRQSLVSFC